MQFAVFLLKCDIYIVLLKIILESEMLRKKRGKTRKDMWKVKIFWSFLQIFFLQLMILIKIKYFQKFCCESKVKLILIKCNFSVEDRHEAKNIQKCLSYHGHWLFIWVVAGSIFSILWWICQKSKIAMSIYHSTV